MQQLLKYGLLLLSVYLISACSTINSTAPTTPVYASSRWGITPLTNNTEIPQAGARAAAITADMLRSRGVLNLVAYQNTNNCSQLLTCANSNVTTETALAWARRSNLRYVMMGSVNEWDYKVGLDGEPAVAVTLQLYDTASERVIWSAVGSKTGSSRSGLGTTAQNLINSMLGSLVVNSQ